MADTRLVKARNRLQMSAANRVRFHKTLQWAWALALVPTLLWWSDSILWVAFMSLYANFVGHAGAAEAAKAANGDL